MRKVCKNCACFDVCKFADPDRTVECTINWQPIITYCQKCRSLRRGRVAFICNHPNGLKHPNLVQNTFCMYGEENNEAIQTNQQE
jgi:hypothetical protein